MKPKCIHCDKLANNGTMTLCNKHVDKLRRLNRLKDKINLAINKLRYKYYIEDECIGEIDDSCRWIGIEVIDGYGDTWEEFIDNLIIAHTDQDGGEVATLSFEEADNKTQETIMSLAGYIEEK